MTNPAVTEAATAAERSAYQAVFDADYYRSAYPDVAAAFGNNKAALFNHFVNYGLREGRSCSADFNPQAYRAKYADLQQAFGDDMAAYCRHYVTCGKAEGRDGGGTGSASAATVTDAATTDTASVQGNVIGAQVFQARGDLGLHVGFGQRAAFGRQNEVIPQPGLLQRLADPCLADRVGAGGGDVIDARLMRGEQQLPRAGLVDALNGNAAKPKAGDL